LKRVAPPNYDPLGYIQKGHRLWSEIRSGQFTNPLNHPPVARPPGGVPFFFPTGYGDFRSFLFWSVFSPVAIWALTLWLAVNLHAPPGR
jgi:hypothetical protein